MFSGVPMVQKSLKIAENGEKNAPTGEKTCGKNACEKKTTKRRFSAIFGPPPGASGGVRGTRVVLDRHGVLSTWTPQMSVFAWEVLQFRLLGVWPFRGGPLSMTKVMQKA